MKHSPLVLPMFLCAAFVGGTAYAAHPSAASQRPRSGSDANTASESGSPRAGMVHAKKSAANKIPITSSQYPASRARRSNAETATKIAQPRQSATNKAHRQSARPASVNAGVRSVPRPTTATVQNEEVSSGLPTRLPAITAYTSSSFHSVRHRNPNPAIVEGLPSAKAGSAGLNGTLVNRRP